MTMMTALLADYDFNLPLNDALNDPALCADRRALAAVSMRQGLDDAYLIAGQLCNAMRLLWADAKTRGSGGGDAQDRLDAILVADGDDYQRRLFWILSERPLAEAVDALLWLTDLLRGRARMYPMLQQAGAPLPFIPGDDRDDIDPIGCPPLGF